MTPEQKLLGCIAQIEQAIETLGNDLDAQRQAARAKLLALNAERDRMNDALKAIRANLTHLLPAQLLVALGIESQAGVGTPGN